jgi:hypothetical protein
VNPAVKDEEVSEALSKPPEVNPFAEDVIVSVVWVVDDVDPVKVNSLFDESQPKPADSEVIESAVSKKAICPMVPEPVIPLPEPAQLPSSTKQKESSAPSWGMVAILSADGSTTLKNNSFPSLLDPSNSIALSQSSPILRAVSVAEEAVILSMFIPYRKSPVSSFELVVLEISNPVSVWSATSRLNVEEIVPAVAVPTVPAGE